MVVALHLTANTNEVKYYDEVADDASTSSTIPVHQSSVKPPSVTQTQSKRVQFNHDLDEYHSSEFAKEDTCDQWYQVADYKFFRTSSLQAAQQIVATEKRNRAPYSYQRVLERVYDVCNVDSHSAQTAEKSTAGHCVHLHRWLSVATTRVGLEKWSIRRVAVDKVARRQTMVRVVAQASARGHTDDQVRVQLERLSRPSSLFARALASGVATVVRRDEYDNVARAAC